MAELQQLRVQEAAALVRNPERESVLKRQGLMFQCSSDCREDSRPSMQQVPQCIERCHMPLAHGQALVTGKLEKFRNHPAWCTMHCNDKAKDSIDAGTD